MASADMKSTINGNNNEGIIAGRYEGNQYNTYNVAKETVDETAARQRDLILQSIPRSDLEELRDKKGDRIDGTCTWLWDNEAFNSWFSSQQGLLWIIGSPGKGKTMIAMYIYEEMLRRKEREGQVIHFFCKNDSDKHNCATALLRSLIYQILEASPQMTDIVAKEMKDPTKSELILGSHHTLWQLFEQLLADPRLPALTCILDGLDECDKSSVDFLRRKLIHIFATPTLARIGHVRMVLLSRDILEMRSSLCLPLDTLLAQIHGDIELVISAKLNPMSERIDDTKAFDKIREKLSSHAGGTFLWAGFVINDLSKQSSKAAIFESIEKFPSEVDDIYSRILRSIPNEDKQQCADILLWTALAIRPMSLIELSRALGMKATEYVKEEEKLRSQINKCGQMVHVVGDYVSLVHQSVRDYLLQGRPTPEKELDMFETVLEDGHCDIAKRCVEYLEQSPIKSYKKYTGKDFANNIIEYPFLDYALRFWSHHTRLASTRFTEIRAHVPNFFAESEGSPLRLRVLDRNGSSVITIYAADRSVIATELGLTEWFRCLLVETPAWVWWRLILNPWCRSEAFWLALRKDNEEIVGLILDTGFNVNWIILEAIKGKHYKVAQVFVEKGALLNGIALSVGRMHELQHDGFEAREVILRLCIEHHIKHKAKQDWSSYQWLMIAVKARIVDMIQKLLADGCLVSVHGHGNTGQHRCVLEASITASLDTEIVAMLWDKFEDKVGRDSYHGACEAPELAVEYGRLDVLQLLMRHKSRFANKDWKAPAINRATRSHQRKEMLKLLHNRDSGFPDALCSIGPIKQDVMERLHDLLPTELWEEC